MGPSQEAVIRAALADARVAPGDVSYVETHGTGTALGDPIEVQALGEALREGRAPDAPVTIGSVKTNVGHLEATAGIAGLMKAVLMLQHREIPPHLHFETPSPHIPWDRLPVTVGTDLRPWSAAEGQRVVGVSSFGFSGTNAHLVLGEAPEPAAELRVDAEVRPLRLLPLSARTEDALQQLARRYAEVFGAAPEIDLRDVCYTASTGRVHFEHRLALPVQSAGEAQEKLKRFSEGHDVPGLIEGQVSVGARPKVAFLFTGQGSQYPGMGRALYDAHPAFRDALDRCDRLLTPLLGRPLLEVVFADDDESAGAIHQTEVHQTEVHQTAYTQPALFALEYALSELWRSWGVAPAAVLGHSIGEIVAAHVAGVFSLEDALRLVAARGRLMQALPTEGPAAGAMAAVMADAARVDQAIAPHAGAVSIAAYNGPEHVVISGTHEAVEEVALSLEAEGVSVRRLRVSHAFHSALMEPMLEAFRREAEAVTYRAPSRARLVSNVTGELAGSEVAGAAYWVEHVRAAVRFEQGMEALWGVGCRVFVEVGPHPVLVGMGRECVGGEGGGEWVPTLRRGRSDEAQVAEAVGQLYTAGVELDWARVAGPGRRVTLPTYPFQRKRYWVPDAKQARRGTPAPNGTATHPILGRQLHSALKAVQFEQVLAVDELPVLDDHRVFDRAVLPATAYVEAALAAARAVHGAGDVVLEEVSIQDALVVEEARLAQFILTPEDDRDVWALYSSEVEAGGDWKQHASGTLCVQPATPPPHADLSTIRARCAEMLTREAHYATLQSLGLTFGPSLHGVVRLQRGRDEALGEIRLPEACEGDADRYQFHPALLDACLQTLAAVATSASDEAALFMPIGWDRLHVYGTPGVHLFSHVTMHAADGPETRTADVRVLDPEGRVVAELEGLRLKRATAAALRRSVGESAERRLYEVDWQSQPLEARASSVHPQELVDQIAPRYEALRNEHRLDGWESLAPELDALSTAYVVAALRELGWTPSQGDSFTTALLSEALKIQSSYHRLVQRMLAMLAEDGALTVEGEAWAVVRVPEVWSPEALEARRQALLEAYPAYDTELVLVGQCGPHLAEALRGTADPLQLLFPDGSSEVAERLYSEAPLARVYGTATAEAVAAAQARTAEKLRVLEIGGGTGGLTSFVLPKLDPQRTDYTFSDVSPLFVARARERFAAYPFLHFDTLDAERDPLAQGFRAQQYDLILAANVIHATKDLRRTLHGLRQLLAPGGMLVMLEIMQPMRWIDITFGLTDGWWHFTDTDLRPDYPLIPPRAWQDLLVDCGFDAVGVIPERPELPEQAVLLARNAASVVAPEAEERWLILADEHGVGLAVADRLRAQGKACTVVARGEVDPAQPGGVEGVLETAESWAHVVHLWSLDSEEPENVEALEATQQNLLGGVLRVVQAAARQEEAPRLWLITRGAQPAGDGAPLAVAQAPVWGVGKVIELEHPELRCTRIDLDPAENDAEVGMLLDEFAQDEAECQVAFRGGERRVARLVASETLSQMSAKTEQTGPMRLAITSHGTLDGLAFERAERRQPERGEVEIEVRASGLNFKDVLKTLGMAPEDTRPIGGECAGVVTVVGAGVTDLQPGDRVLAVGAGCFGSYVTMSADFVVPIPSDLSFEEAATLPVAFITAAFALRHLGRLVGGERVLIHAAAGGVGMAAVQLALRAGAEVFGTAGSPEKRALLTSLGVHHVMDSRSLDFAGEVRGITEGEGVDLVLNSLADDFIPASLGVLREGGRFLELGKRGLLSEAEVMELPKRIEYTAIDWSVTAEEDPELIRRLLVDVVAEVEAGTLTPLPRRTFPLEHAVEAFRFMAQARHVGKIVMTRSGHSDAVVRPGFTYLITGGLSGLGLRVAQWLAEEGATHLALVGRRTPSGAAQEVLADLAQKGVHVQVLQADISSEQAVDAALAEVGRTMPVLRGVVHAAGVLDDGALLQQDWSRFATVLAPKVSGAWLLHDRTRRHPLDFFVLFSSAASLLGSAGQSNHAAANMFMDVLAHQRRREGLPALSINWGVWSEIGAAAERGMDEHAAEQGLGVITPGEGIGTFARLLRGAPPQVGVVPVYWDVLLAQHGTGAGHSFFEHVARRPVASQAAGPPSAASDPGVRARIAAAAPAKQRPLLVAHVADEVRRVLGLDASDRVDPRRPLNEQGMDSLMAVELRNRLKTSLTLERGLPATLVFDYPTVEAIADFVGRQVLAVAEPGAGSAAEEQEASGDILDMLDAIEQLSADEVERLLTK